MRIFEIADAEAQLALWKLVNDSVWTAIQTQQHEQAKQKAAAQQQKKSKRSKRISKRSISAPAPLPKIPKPMPKLAAPNKLTANPPQQPAQKHSTPTYANPALSHTHKLKQHTHLKHYQQQAPPSTQTSALQPVTLLRKSTLYNSNVSNHYHHKMRYWRKRSVFYPINVRK